MTIKTVIAIENFEGGVFGGETLLGYFPELLGDGARVKRFDKKEIQVGTNGTPFEVGTNLWYFIDKDDRPYSDCCLLGQEELEEYTEEINSKQGT